MRSPLLLAGALCLLAALAEALAAGRGIRARFREIRFPRASIPLSVWPLVAVLYYAMCFVVAYRLLGMEGRVARAGIVVLVLVMATNAAWNALFFRARSLRGSFLLSIPYSLLCVALFLLVWRADRTAAIPVAAYLVYLIYANVWGYRLWRINEA